MNLTQTLLLTALLALGPAQAADKSADGGHEHMTQMFMKQATIDGYKVTYHVMPATADMQMGSSHTFMVKIDKDGKLPEVTINSKVIFPDKTSATKMMMRMGDWYMAGYDLGKTGKHQLLILFKTRDGAKHQGGVYYP